jgi:hypothetical protein
MIIRILASLLVLIVVIFIGYWIFTGGPARGINFAKSVDNPLDFFTSTTTGGSIRLPGQPDELLPGIDISQYTGEPGSDEMKASSYERLSQLQQQYDELYAKVKDPKNFGNPSPYRGKVSFAYNTAKSSSASAEYLTLQADYRNTAPVPLNGWSIQSAVTGLRVGIPPGAQMFVSGTLNSVAAVSLDPGASAIALTAASPVGVSFRENRCTGYLGELQTFTPELQRNCPTAQEELPLNAQNIQTYGDECVDYVKSIPRCHFPGTDPNTTMSQSCKNFLLNRLTYNGCVYAHRGDLDFYGKDWRLYLGSGAHLWRDTHDVIRLLDAEGRTVDVLTY